MKDLVKELESKVAHGVRLLRDGRIDGSVPNRVQRALVGVPAMTTRFVSLACLMASETGLPEIARRNESVNLSGASAAQ